MRVGGVALQLLNLLLLCGSELLLRRGGDLLRLRMRLLVRDLLLGLLGRRAGRLLHLLSGRVLLLARGTWLLL